MNNQVSIQVDISNIINSIDRLFKITQYEKYLNNQIELLNPSLISL